MASKTSSLWRALRSYQIYGANTDVGKTVMSTILCKALVSKSPSENVWYLKPVSTGPLSEADNRHISQFSPETRTHCLYQFDEAVSPHIAARSKPPLPDSDILQNVLQHLKSCAEAGPGVTLLETAGGVHSPTPSGTSQADLYRSLRLPICLVADHKLGGISASISAFESLHFEDSHYQNHAYLREYFEKKDIKTIAIPAPPKRNNNDSEDFEMMAEYYKNMSKHDAVEELLDRLTLKHEKRIENLEDMAGRAHKQIWYPFTQHKDVSEKTILTVDSAYGDFFQTRVREGKEENLLTPTFDGSASWWTQGLGHGNPDLSLAAAYAAGRYGHVMFAGAINEPSLLLAESLLGNMHNPRLQKVFYSDNGSTGMEVAAKMALAASSQRYKYNVAKGEVGILGLKGSYHGDTIGTMDCSEPCIYNEKVHWYQGRGYWFDFPEVKLKKGNWVVESPAGMEAALGSKSEYDSLNDIFDIEARNTSSTAKLYRKYIEATLERLVLQEGKTFGALIMEPVILGAGGMHFVDPLFQHTLVSVVRESSNIFSHGTSYPQSDPNAWTGLPVVFDEVFTGLYRLGRFSAASFVQTHPDISCHAKLLTGGLVPLCTTLASDSIYDAFLSSDKRDALLHGHSYTAHAVGCHVANTSLNVMMDLDQSGEWQPYKDDWGVGHTFESTQSESKSMPGKVEIPVWSSWSKDFIHKISMSKDVDSVIALGSVLAIALHDEHAGYTSSATTGLQERMLEGCTQFNIHSRVLGNVFYLMASQTSKPETLRDIEKLLSEALL
ncbi:Bifunctional dethiobiotin synthetase 7 [Hyphodiscus hymeniophilus]|uniref:Bifunctional dethiobiotin synthetase 7 n=1 Tax=Hyphodiscus hymeniophilus TaxID=353542 RepID=A0A9P7AW12_9HELO|nr:Bifunctional dethiobiotin synthetase 7 [Hyphodiscus hymeniophilus]